MTREQLGLEETVLEEAHRFEFFQAIRLLERIYRDRDPLASRDAAENEVARFRTHVSLAFPASEIHAILQSDPDTGTPQPTVQITFFGLVGLLGVLPNHYTQLLAHSDKRRQTAPVRVFLDLFTHRLVSLFYKAWEKYRFPIAYERRHSDVAAAPNEGSDGARDVESDSRRTRDPFSEYLFSLIGLGTPGLQQRQHVDDDSLLYYAGLLSQRPRSAAVLEGILNDYFEVPVRVEQFTGEWFLLNPDSLTHLGMLGHNGRLGVDAVLWEHIWDPQARFRIRIGPLDYTQFLEFLPGGAAYRRVEELTRFIVADEFGFEVQPVLKADEVPYSALGDPRSARLGWSMWLKTQKFTTDTDQPVFGVRIARQLEEGAA